MEVLERDPKQKTVLGVVCLVGLAAFLILIILLITTATSLHGPVSKMTVERAGIENVSFFEISKVPLHAGGYQATIKFLPGLWLYITFWAAVAAAISWLRLRSSRVKTTTLR